MFIDPPEFIRERLESTRILLEKARNPSIKSSKDAGQEAEVEYLQVQVSMFLIPRQYCVMINV